MDKTSTALIYNKGEDGDNGDRSCGSVGVLFRLAGDTMGVAGTFSVSMAALINFWARAAPLSGDRGGGGASGSDAGPRRGMPAMFSRAISPREVFRDSNVDLGDEERNTLARTGVTCLDITAEYSVTGGRDTALFLPRERGRDEDVARDGRVL